jgi:hypothetical protein
VVTAHPIEIAASNSDVSEARGLDPGTLVAMDNFNRLNDGAKISIRPPPDGAKGSTSNGPAGNPNRGRKGGS